MCNVKGADISWISTVLRVTTSYRTGRGMIFGRGLLDELYELSMCSGPSGCVNNANIVAMKGGGATTVPCPNQVWLLLFEFESEKQLKSSK